MPTYPGLSSEAFRHPLDRQAEQALHTIPGFALVTRAFIQYFAERPQKIYLLGNSIQAGPRQYSTLYGIFRECLKDLDITTEPALYVVQNPAVNAYALGHDQPYIVINSGLLDLFNQEELRCIVAHELGHIKCDHTTLTEMARWASGAASILGELTLGIGSLITTGLILAFYEWKRKAELSADRACLLVTDNLTPIHYTLMKMAGVSGKYAHECNLSEFIRQSDYYQELDQDALNQLYKFLIYNGGSGTFLSHPFPVERVRYLQDWANSDEYRQIKLGNYTKNEAEGAVNVSPTESSEDVETLRKQIEELQAEINRVKQEKSSE